MLTLAKVISFFELILSSIYDLVTGCCHKCQAIVKVCEERKKLSILFQILVSGLNLFMFVRKGFNIFVVIKR